MTGLARPSALPWDPEVGHPHRRSILAICCLCLVLVVLAVSSLNVAIPTISTELRPTATQLLWIIDSYALVFAGLLLPAGAMGDRFGRKGALLTGLGIFVLGALAASLTTSPWPLVATRSIMGVGAAFVMPATLSIVTTVFAPADRPAAIATWAGFAGAGSATGPPLSGFLLEHFWWGSVFFINIPVAAVAAVLVATRVPTSRDTTERRLDVVGAAISVLALGSLLFGIIEGPEKGWSSGVVLGAFAVAAAATVAFVRWELHTPDPMLDPRFFRIPWFRTGSAVVTVIFFGMFGMFFLITQYLQQVKGFSPLLAGLGTIPSAATLLVVTPRSPLVVARLGRRRTIVAGMGLCATGFLTFSMLTPSSPYLHVAAALVCTASGMGLSMAPASTAIVSSLPQTKAGVASAVNDVTREVGGALGIAVLGSVLSSRYSSLFRDGLDAAVPDALARRSSDSIGLALAAAEAAPGPVADALAALARASFTGAMSAAFRVSAVLVATVAVLVALRKDQGAGGAGADGPTVGPPTVGPAGSKPTDAL